MDTLEANIEQALPSALKMALYAAKKQHLEMLKYTIEGVDSLCNNAAFLKDLESQEHLDETAKEFAVLGTQLSRYKTQLEKLEPLVESGKLDQKKIDKVLKDALVKPIINPSKHEFYKKFCDKAGIELEMDGDDDLLIQESESTRSTICPVTQMEMKEPLRNPRCGHAYSKQDIQSHLQRSKTCPVAGCSQKLLFNNLERDVEMEVIIARNQHASEQQRAQGAAPMDQDDDDEEEDMSSSSTTTRHVFEAVLFQRLPTFSNVCIWKSFINIFCGISLSVARKFRGGRRYCGFYQNSHARLVQ